MRYDEIDDLLDKGSHTFALVILEGFERRVRQGQPVSLQLNIDATRMSQAFIGTNSIQRFAIT